MSAMQECQQGGNGRNLKYAAQCSDIPLSITQLQRLQRIAPSMKRLENPECINAFGMDYVSNYRSLLLVSTTITDTASVLHFPVTPGIAWGVGGSYAWMCKDGQFLSGQLNVEGVPCFPKSLNVSNWQMYSYSLVSNGTILVDVDHCLAEPTTTPGCNVNLSRSLLIVVICFNLVKILCFIAVLNVCRSPLITVGDTMASFLERADSTTRDYGSISALEIRRSGAWRQKYRSGMSSTHRFLSGYRPNRKWDVRHLRWHRAASWQRWLLATVV